MNKEVNKVLIKIKDILWSGGKRDDFSVIDEFNKLLLIKIKHELSGNKDISNLNMSFSNIENEFYNATTIYDVYSSKDKLNVNSIELIEIFHLLNELIFTEIKNFELFYYKVFVETLNSSSLASNEIITFLSKLLVKNQKSILCSDSLFGQLPLKINNNKISLDSIESNMLCYYTHQILNIIKYHNIDHNSYNGSFFSNNYLSKKYDLIISIPPVGAKTNANLEYSVNLNKKNIEDLSSLYFKRSYDLLKENGFLYIIVSDGLLFNQSSQILREFVKDKFEVYSIVSLSNNVFYKSNVKTSLLILKKVSFISSSYNILMLDISEENSNTKELITNHIEINQHNKYTIKNDVLEDRWDVNYYKNEYLNILYKIKNLNYKYLGELVNIRRGSNLKIDNEGESLLLTASSIEDGIINKEKLYRVSNVSENNQRGIIFENEILITVAGKIGACARVTKEIEGINTNTAIVILNLKTDIITSDYLVEYLNSMLGQKLIERIISGSVVPVINQKDIATIPIVLDNYESILNEIEEIKNLPLFGQNFVDKNEVLIDEENISSFFNFHALKGEVFGLDVIRTFINLEDLQYFKTDKQDFQRELNENHKTELVDYLKNKDYKFFPEIVLGIRNSEEYIKNGVLTINYITESSIFINFNINTVKGFDKDIFDDIEILDGRHRIESIKKYIKEDNSKSSMTVSMVFILLNDTHTESLLDKVIFYNLNSKARVLEPLDYLNLLNTDKEDKLKELKIVDINIFKFLKKESELLYDVTNSTVLEKCISLTNYLVKQYDDKN